MTEITNSYRIVFQGFLVRWNGPPPAPTSQQAAWSMKDAKVVSIAHTRNLAKNAPLPEEAWADVSDGGDAAQKGSVELVEAETSRGQGNGSDNRLGFSVGPPIPIERVGGRGNGRC